MLLHSIRFKIVLWHMLILSLALLIFGMVLYHNFYLKIANDTDDILRSRAKGIEQSIDTYWEAEQMDIAAGDSKIHFAKEDNINFIKIAKRWVGEKINDPDLINIIVRVYDAHGSPIASSKNIPHRAPLIHAFFMMLKKARTILRTPILKSTKYRLCSGSSLPRSLKAKGFLTLCKWPALWPSCTQCSGICVFHYYSCCL